MCPWNSPTRRWHCSWSRWTEGALIALHFALRSNDGSTDAAVWLLDPYWLNQHTLRTCHLLPNRTNLNYEFVLDYTPDPRDPRTEWICRYLPPTFEKEELPLLPAAVSPQHIDRRIVAQLSAFTIHGKAHYGLERAARTSDEPRLAQIRIPRANVRRVQQLLTDCGVGETTVFNDVEALGRELAHLHTGVPLVPASRGTRRRSRGPKVAR
jgi:hypothetical protein